ncbi:MAG TPA: iron ABC transporter permease [Bacteroidales bacterium]|nr:iron ABC transporter permease [Bacteroidales bacterium]HPI68962.1 iron ABC transporter permease [Bacteroidales bacterium]
MRKSGYNKESLHKWHERGNRSYIFILLGCLLILFFFLDIILGSVYIRFTDLYELFTSDANSSISTIIFRFRLPKAITASLVGVALSLSGLQMQTLFRNPMAGPYVLGVSSGASLGVAMVILGFYSGLGNSGMMEQSGWILVISGWLGAGSVMLLMMLISTRVRDIMTILIIGIMLASGLSAVVSIMQYFSNETMLKAYVIWTMGSLGNLSSDQLKVLTIAVLTGLLLGVALIKKMNALNLGENYASSMGMNVRITRTLIFACTSILAGSVTAFCGPIGFIGIAIPHVVRNMFRTSDHKILLPGTVLTGAIVMLGSDIISQLPGSESVIPVNSVTALIGIPIVLWIILHNKKISGLG